MHTKPLRHVVVALVVAGALVSLRCQRTRQEPEGLAGGAIATAKVPTSEGATPQAEPAGDRHEIEGLSVTFEASGPIAFVGKDRWGAPLDTHYESLEYLEKALPILARQLTETQSAALAELVRARRAAGAGDK